MYIISLVSLVYTVQFSKLHYIHYSVQWTLYTIWIAHYSGIKYIIYIYIVDIIVIIGLSNVVSGFILEIRTVRVLECRPTSTTNHAHRVYRLSIDTPRQASISTHLHRVTVTTWYKDARFHYAIVNTQQITSFSGTWLQDRRAHRKTRLQMHLNHAHNGNRPTLTPAPHTPQTTSITISMGQYNLKLI